MTCTHTAIIPAHPDAVFEAITGIDGLPAWNDAITAVVDAPSELVDGAEWVVELHALGQRWHSRSTVTSLEPEARRFGYRSRTDDGNPSWVDWRWSVDEHLDGAEVTVEWHLHPATFWRKVLFVHIRRRQLARTEIPASLTALGRHVAAATNPA
jgi:uncharacterized protein YndB with AHSA1/START domain